MDNDLRIRNYFRQNGTAALTPRQSKRVSKHENKHKEARGYRRWFRRKK